MKILPRKIAIFAVLFLALTVSAVHLLCAFDDDVCGEHSQTFGARVHLSKARVYVPSCNLNDCLFPESPFVFRKFAEVVSVVVVPDQVSPVFRLPIRPRAPPIVFA